MTLALAAGLFGVAGIVLFLSLRSAPAEGDAAAAATVIPGVPVYTPGFVDRVVVPSLSGLAKRLYRILPPGKIAAIRRKIVLAGKQSSWSIEKALALKVLGIAVGVLFTVGAMAMRPGPGALVFGGLVLFCGFYGPDYTLDKAARGRQLEIQRALADMLDQITVCVEAGLGFDAAMHRTVANNRNALADEFGRTIQDIRLGMPRSTAFNNLLDRTNVPDLRLFIRAILQADKSGVPLARILRVQSDEVREKRRQAAEERAMKLPVLLMVPLVLCILPSLFIVIMGPAVLRLMGNGVA